MISIASYFSSAITNGRRIISSFQFGAKTTFEVAPFGDDSCPPQGLNCVTAETQNDSSPVVLGYVNNNQLAGPGEKRMYAVTVDDQAVITQAFYTWMKADGTYEIGGTTDNLVRWNALNNGLSNHTEALQAELKKIQIAIESLGGSYIPENISIDINASRIDEIKTL